VGDVDYGSLFTLGHAVTCDVAAIWPDLTTVPGILVGYEDGLFRVMVALPGDAGAVRAVSLPGEKLA